jgi:orotidine 5'-phosphate decarboxylase subfamily 2
MIDQLIANIKKTNAPIVVGLDPMMKFIPEQIQKAAFAEYGETLKGAAEAIWQYNKGIVDAVADLIPAVKPQIAMYEQFGVEGLKAFQKTVDYCHEKDLVVIGDVKRGDIGSTSAAYATGHLGKVQVGSKTYRTFNEDFATVNPYLGTDGIKPFADVCKEEKKGLFILVKTSNPSSGEFQDRLIDGKPLYEHVAEKVAAWGEDVMGDEYSYIGAVVGATYPEVGKVLRQVMPKSFILVPGYGAQGGKGKDLTHYFNKDGLGAIVNSSRGIIAAYKQEKYAQFGAENFADASRQAVIDMIEDMAEKFKEQAVIISQEEIAPAIYSLWIKTDKIAQYAKAGQFISIYCEDGSRLLPRPISICEIDKEDCALHLVYRIAGAGTEEFSQKQTGDHLSVMGPLGNGFPLKSKKAFLIGGGIGIPPMLELAKQLNCEKQIILGYRNSDMFLLDEFKKQGEVYIATEDGSVGSKGNVLDAIRENELDAEVIYACGPTPMLRALKQYASKNHMECWISMEEKMACGIGACLACVCKSKEVDGHTNVHNKRVCKEGPVFLAEEVEL